MTCANCNVELDGGYQSSENLNLCQPCADWEKQGKEPCIGCGAEVCEKCGKLDQPHDPCDCVECIQCGALNCEDIMCRYPDMGQSDSEDESDRAAIEDYEDGMTDMEADADTLRSCGWGTDEDYGYFGEE